MNNTPHYFTSSMTIDGRPVNKVETSDNRKIYTMLQDRPDGYYRLLKKEDLHPAYHKSAVYLWTAADEYEE